MPAPWLDYLLAAAGLALAVRYGTIWVEMARLPAWLRREAAAVGGAVDRALARGEPLPRLVFVVPALDETRTLPHTIAGLARATPPALREHVRIVVVTTEKERVRRAELLDALAAQTASRAVLPTPRLNDALERADPELAACVRGGVAVAGGDGDPSSRWSTAREVVATWPYTWDHAGEVCDLGVPVAWMHAMSPSGNMATQLNVALSQIAAEEADAADRTYVVVYNADTVPDAGSVLRTAELLLHERFPVAAQLMCVAMLNFRAIAARPAGFYAAGAAIYQSRWALGYEFRMLRRAADRRVPSLQAAYHYCRGHGMTFRLDYLTATNGFEERTALEDLFQGYALSCRGLPCLPVPVLEWTEHPATARELVRQKRFWFGGMLDLPRYGGLLAAHGISGVSRWRRARFMAIGLYREIGTWLLGPTLTGAFVAACVVQGSWWGVLPLLNAVVSVALVIRATPAGFRPDPRGVRGFAQLAGAMVGAALYSVSRNVGPALAFATRISQGARNAGRSAAVSPRLADPRERVG
jgi:cellulose synthase/poly-beta-1,6-N-acetylglucosamine synthase-like glycosyltransferase